MNFLLDMTVRTAGGFNMTGFGEDKWGSCLRSRVE